MHMRWFAFMVMAGLAAGVKAESARLENVRIWAAPDNTRIVFDVSAPVEHRIATLEDPKRVVIDIPRLRLNTSLPAAATEDQFVYQLRSGQQGLNDLRVVLDIKQTVAINSFLLPPNQHYGHRLVVDLSGTGKTPSLATTTLPDTPAGSRDVVIAIDAGHGGDDPGARGPGGAWEKNLVLQISRKLAERINREQGMRAVLVREGDYFLPLRRRIERAREHKSDLFVSIHADAFRDSRVRGASVYVLSERGASSEAARWLAERENASDLVGGVSLDVQDETLASVLLDLSQTASLEMSIDVAERVLGSLKNMGNIRKRQVQSAGFAVLKAPDIPSILIETAYISNPEEEKKLRDPAYQQQLANAILQGLRGYFQTHAPEGTLLAAQAKRKYIIVRGDTLSTVAERYRVSTRRLREYNGLDTDLVQVGQVLSIPVDG